MAKEDTRTATQRRTIRRSRYNYDRLHEFGGMCPLCQQTGLPLENHHCLDIYLGGDSSPWNILRICRSCHRLLDGNPDDIKRLRLMVHYIQLSRYGLLWALYYIRRSRKMQEDKGLELLIKKGVSAYMESGMTIHECDWALRRFGLVMLGIAIKETDDVISIKLPAIEKPDGRAAVILQSIPLFSV